MSNDKPHDSYTIDLEEGDRLTVVMTSTEIDTYLYANAPSGRNFAYNDDCTSGDYTKSCLTVNATVAGTYEIIATVFDAAETGAYRIEMTVNE